MHQPLGNCPVTKIDFNPENYAHRLMLALAVRDYTNTPGQSVSGAHEGDRKSLLKELEDGELRDKQESSSIA